MPAITLVIAQAHLDAWLAADIATAGGQSYKIGERALTRADAAEIRENIVFWQGQADALAAGTTSIRGRLITPIT